MNDDDRVPHVRVRLDVASAGGATYDKPLADAVRKFQATHKLSSTGMLDAVTVKALNGGPRDQQTDVIIAKMERCGGCRTILGTHLIRFWHKADMAIAFSYFCLGVQRKSSFLDRMAAYDAVAALTFNRVDNAMCSEDALRFYSDRNVNTTVESGTTKSESCSPPRCNYVFGYPRDTIGCICRLHISHRGCARQIRFLAPVRVLVGRSRFFAAQSPTQAHET